MLLVAAQVSLKLRYISQLKTWDSCKNIWTKR